MFNEHPELVAHCNAPIIFVTDPEGSKEFWDHWKTLIAHHAVDKGEPLYYICGGDVSGSKGSYGLRVLHEIKMQCLSEKKWVALIAGNRDDNRLRFLTELANESFLHNFLDPSARLWMSKEASLLDDFPEDIYPSLTIPQKRVYVAKWMLARTMGSAGEFECRRQELKEILGDKASISDEQVAQSFIEEMCDDQLLMKYFPDPSERVLPQEYQGVAFWYIKHSNLYALRDAALYSHSSYQQNDCPKDVDVNVWIENSNASRHENISSLLDMLKSDSSFDLEDNFGRNHLAITGSLPRGKDYPHNHQSQNFYHSYDNPKQTITLPPEVMLNMSGHQPVLQSMPVVIRDHMGKMIVNADTANPAPGGAHVPSYIQINSDASVIIRSADGQQEVNSDDSLIGKMISHALDDGSVKHFHVTSKDTNEDKYYLNCYEQPAGMPFYSITNRVCINKSVLQGKRRRIPSVDLLKQASNNEKGLVVQLDHAIVNEDNIVTGCGYKDITIKSEQGIPSYLRFSVYHKTITFFLGSLIFEDVVSAVHIAFLANALAKAQYHIVFGGEFTGLMGVLALSVVEFGGANVTGVSVPNLPKETYSGVSEEIRCLDVPSRIEVMTALSRIFVVCVGGPGTLNEVCELMKNYPDGSVDVYLFNTGNFYHLDKVFQGIEEALGDTKEENLTYKNFRNFCLENKDSISTANDLLMHIESGAVKRQQEQAFTTVSSASYFSPTTPELTNVSCRTATNHSYSG